MTATSTAYIRTKAKALRDRGDDLTKVMPDSDRDQYRFAARQLEITADEIDHGFHLGDG